MNWTVLRMPLSAVALITAGLFYSACEFKIDVVMEDPASKVDVPGVQDMVDQNLETMQFILDAMMDQTEESDGDKEIPEESRLDGDEDAAEFIETPPDGDGAELDTADGDVDAVEEEIDEETEEPYDGPLFRELVFPRNLLTIDFQNNTLLAAMQGGMVNAYTIDEGLQLRLIGYMVANPAPLSVAVCDTYLAVVTSNTNPLKASVKTILPENVDRNVLEIDSTVTISAQLPDEATTLSRVRVLDCIGDTLLIEQTHTVAQTGEIQFPDWVTHQWYNLSKAVFAMGEMKAGWDYRNAPVCAGQPGESWHTLQYIDGFALSDNLECDAQTPASSITQLLTLYDFTTEMGWAGTSLRVDYNADNYTAKMKNMRMIGRSAYLPDDNICHIFSRDDLSTPIDQFYADCSFDSWSGDPDNPVAFRLSGTEGQDLLFAYELSTDISHPGIYRIGSLELGVRAAWTLIRYPYLFVVTESEPNKLRIYNLEQTFEL